MKESESFKFICHEMSTPPLDKHTTIYCQGSECAAWEWLDPKKRIGYCGKVGKPLAELYR